MFEKHEMSPCYGCTRRTVGCHSGCADYNEWAKKRNEEIVTSKRARQVPLTEWRLKKWREVSE